MQYTLCIMRYALCAMHYALCIISYALCRLYLPEKSTIPSIVFNYILAIFSFWYNLFPGTKFIDSASCIQFLTCIFYITDPHLKTSFFCCFVVFCLFVFVLFCFVFVFLILCFDWVLSFFHFPIYVVFL